MEDIESKKGKGTATNKQAAHLVLSFAAGATDAFAFLALGGIFTANMTGNLVLIGLIQRAHYIETLLGAGTAIIVFTVALFVGFRRTRHTVPDDTRADEGHLFMLLAVATGAQATVLAGWIVAAAVVAFGLQLLLIAFSAMAMAFQTVIGRRLSAQAGLTTTYVTGTITSLIQHIAEGTPDNRILAIAAIAALVAGSFVGAICMVLQPLVGPLPPVIASVIALFLLRPTTSQESSSHAKF